MKWQKLIINLVSFETLTLKLGFFRFLWLFAWTCLAIVTTISQRKTKRRRAWNVVQVLTMPETPNETKRANAECIIKLAYLIIKEDWLSNGDILLLENYIKFNNEMALNSIFCCLRAFGGPSDFCAFFVDACVGDGNCCWKIRKEDARVAYTLTQANQMSKILFCFFAFALFLCSFTHS